MSERTVRTRISPYKPPYCTSGRQEITAWFPRSVHARDFVNFRKKNSCIARARCGRAGLKGPRPDLTMTGRCDFASSAGSSKIKIWTSSWHKAQLALCHDEVRILIFDDPAELEKSQCPEFSSAQLYSSRIPSIVFLKGL